MGSVVWRRICQFVGKGWQKYWAVGRFAVVNELCTIAVYKSFLTNMNEQASTYRVAIKWGIFLGLFSVVYSLFLFMSGNIGQSWTGIMSIIISIGGLVLAMREFRTLNGGYMTFGEGTTVGTVTGLISGLLGTAFSWFYMTIIDTNVMANMTEKTREALEANGSLSDDQIDQQMEMMERFQTPGMILGFGLIAAVIGSVIFAMIVAAFMKKEKPSPFA